MSEDTPWAAITILFTLLVLVAGAIGFVAGTYMTYNMQMDAWSNLVEREATDGHCSERGCSLLVTRADSSTDWVWVPRVEPLRPSEKE